MRERMGFNNFNNNEEKVTVQKKAEWFRGRKKL